MSRHDEHAWRAGIEARATINTSALKPSTCQRPRGCWLARLLRG